MNGLLSVTEVMSRLGLGRATVIRWLNAGKLQGQQIGRAWVVFSDSVEEYERSLAGPPTDGMYTANEAAAELGISGPLVHHHLKSGKLKGEKTPEGWRIAAEEVKRFAAEPRKIGRPTKIAFEAAMEISENATDEERRAMVGEMARRIGDLLESPVEQLLNGGKVENPSPAGRPKASGKSEIGIQSLEFSVDPKPQPQPAPPPATPAAGKRAAKKGKKRGE